MIGSSHTITIILDAIWVIIAFALLAIALAIRELLRLNDEGKGEVDGL